MIRSLATTSLASLTLAASLPALAASTGAAPLVATPADLGTAVSAQIACASIFVTGRAEADVLRDDVHALAPFTRDVALTVDRKARTVTASAPGAKKTRTALYRPAVGCTLLTGRVPIAELERQAANIRPMKTQARKPWPLGDALPRKVPEGIDQTALDRAVDDAFREQNHDGYPDTRAILVVHGGTIVAERYAPGFDRNSRLLGWSASKSVAGTLVGLLVDDGVLDLDAPAPVPQWQGVGDPRAAITLRQLLNMTSGLRFQESYQPGTDSIAMLFDASDMAERAASLPLDHAPGSTWRYSSGTTNILSAIVQRATGGTLEGMTRYARKRLFEPTGMTGMVIEPDEAGVMAGSSYAYGTARDWARFGLLYLNNGIAGGKRLLSHDWITFVRTPTMPRRSYAGQFWINDANGSEGQIYENLPADTIMARGHNDQIVAIVPSRDTVIVRLGWTPEGKSFDHDTYLSRILAALPAPAPAR